jgi:murein DD-endopeptidase MepM/ murein hydrolase activator NlpD
MTWVHPFPKKTITARFGDTARRETPHRGTDYAPGANALIKATSAGTIRKIAWSDCLGWYVVQSAWAHNRTYYVGHHHLSCKTHGIDCRGPKVDGCKTPFNRLKVGDKVAQGKAIGRVGNSGSCSRGAHDHVTLSKTINGGVTGAVEDFEKFVDELSKTCKCCGQAIK